MIEEPSAMAGKVYKPKTHITPWKAEGTHSVCFISEPFVDRKGNRARVCTAHYKDKKNKDRECVAWVKWEPMK